MKTTALAMKSTKAGDPYKLFTMEDGHKLAVFQFDSRYGEIDVGTDLPDSVLIFDPAYSSYKLRPLPKGPAIKTPGGYKTVQMEKVMETKAANIEVAQTRKNDAIALSGALRDATLISLQSYKDQPFPTDEEFKAEHIKWTKWMLNQHEQPFL